MTKYETANNGLSTSMAVDQKIKIRDFKNTINHFYVNDVIGTKKNWVSMDHSMVCCRVPKSRIFIHFNFVVVI